LKLSEFWRAHQCTIVHHVYIFCAWIRFSYFCSFVVVIYSLKWKISEGLKKSTCRDHVSLNIASC
jgi:hypothetical protein